MKDELFLYTVNPRRVITGLTGISAIKSPKSVLLTKEDVYTCLQKASVYRRFAKEGINERVNIGNVDRVHREEYISEEDWNKGNYSATGVVMDVEIIPNPDAEEVVESKQEEIAVKVEEPVVAEEIQAEEIEETVEEIIEPAEEEVLEETTSEEVESDDEDWTETIKEEE